MTTVSEYLLRTVQFLQALNEDPGLDPYLVRSGGTDPKETMRRKHVWQRARDQAYEEAQTALEAYVR